MSFTKLFLMFTIILSISSSPALAMQESEDIENEMQTQNIVIKKKESPSHWGLSNWWNNIKKYTSMVACNGKEELRDCFGCETCCWGGGRAECQSQNNECCCLLICSPCCLVGHILCLPAACCQCNEPYEYEVPYKFSTMPRNYSSTSNQNDYKFTYDTPRGIFKTNTNYGTGMPPNVFLDPEFYGAVKK